MLQNAYFLANIGADTAENEQHFAEILPIGRRVGRGGHPGGGVAYRNQDVVECCEERGTPGSEAQAYSGAGNDPFLFGDGERKIVLPFPVFPTSLKLRAQKDRL